MGYAIPAIAGKESLDKGQLGMKFEVQPLFVKMCLGECCDQVRIKLSCSHTKLITLTQL